MPKIKNNQTGEIIEIPESDLGQYGFSSEDYAPFKQQPTAEATTSATLPKDVSQVKFDQDQKSYQQAWRNAKTLGEQQKISDTFKSAKGYDLFGQPKVEKTKDDVFKSTLNLVNNLESMFTEAGGGTKGIGPGARIKGAGATIAGKLGLNEPASVYNDTREGFAATLKGLTGDVGVLTDQDYMRLSKLLPNLGATRKEATDKFNQMRSQIAAKFGGEETPTTFKPKVENTRGALASIADIAFPAATEYIEKGMKGELTQQQKPKTFTESLAGLGGPIGEAIVRPDIAKEVVPAGLEIAIGLETLGGIKGKLGEVKNILNPKKALSEGRKQAAAAIKKEISVDDIIKTGNKYVKQDPTAQKLWENTLRPALIKQKKLSVSDLLEQTKVWNDAYTSAGKVGKTALAGLTDALARSTKEIIRKKAPAVAEYTAKLAQFYGMDNVLKRFGPALIGGAGAGVGGFLVGRAFGQKSY